MRNLSPGSPLALSLMCVCSPLDIRCRGRPLLHRHPSSTLSARVAYPGASTGRGRWCILACRGAGLEVRLYAPHYETKLSHYENALITLPSCKNYCLFWFLLFFAICLFTLRPIVKSWQELMLYKLNQHCNAFILTFYIEITTNVCYWSKNLFSPLIKSSDC